MLPLISHAQVPISAGTTTAQNFDGIGNSATASLPAGWRVDNPATVRTLGTFAAAGTTTTEAGSALPGNASQGIYNFGSSTSVADRAIGGLSSSSGSRTVNLYTQLSNAGSQAIDRLVLAYDVEKYRRGTRPEGFAVQLYYSTDGATWTSAGPDFYSYFGQDASAAVYPSAPGDVQPVSATLALPTSLAAGNTLYLAWSYSVASGSAATNAQALGVDNVVITPRAVPAAEPTTQAAIASVSPTINSATVQLTPGNGTARLLTIRFAGVPPVGPSDGNSYAANPTFASGSATGPNNYVVLAGNATSVTITNLAAGSNYELAVYEYNGNSSSENYLTTAPGTATFATPAGEPTAQATITSATPTTTTASVQLTPGNGSARLLTVRLGGTTVVAPTDGTDYAPNSLFGLGDQTGIGNYVVLSGSATSLTISGLDPGTTYDLAVYEYNGGRGAENYLTSASSGFSFTTVALPAVPGQLVLEDNFDYVPTGYSTTSTLRGNSPWRDFPNNDSGQQSILLNPGSLAQNEYSSSNIGRSVSVGANSSPAEDLFRPFPAQAGATTIYSSFLLSVASVPSPPSLDTYVFALSADSSQVAAAGSTAFRGRVFLRYNAPANGSTTPATYNMGLSFAGEAPVFSSTAYVLNQIQLVVLKYTRATGARNDAVSLYVFPGGLQQGGTTPVSEPSTPLLTVRNQGAVADIVPGGVVLNQDEAANTRQLSFTFDGLRVGTGWSATVSRPVFQTQAQDNLYGRNFFIDQGSYYDVTLTGSTQQVTVTRPVLVQQTLDLTNGRLMSTIQNGVTIAAGAAIDNASANGFVDGPLSRIVSFSSTPVSPVDIIFQTGRDGNYRPVTLTVKPQTTGVATYRLVQIEGPSPNKPLPSNPTTIVRVSQVRYYFVEAIGSTSLPLAEVFIRLSYGADDGITQPSTLSIAQSPDASRITPYNDLGGDATTVASGSIRSQVSNAQLGVFTLSTTMQAQNPLPVELLTFAGKRLSSAVALSWATASERNSAYFEVERSYDGKQFVKVQTVAAAGTTTTQRRYSLLDTDVRASLAYYRLRQVDLDGKVSYSQVIVVAGSEKAAAEVAVFPNPTTDRVTVLLSETAATAPQVKLTDMTGRQLRATTLGPNSTVDLSGLQAGTYLLDINLNGQHIVRRVTKQ